MALFIRGWHRRESIIVFIKTGPLTPVRHWETGVKPPSVNGPNLGYQGLDSVLFAGTKTKPRVTLAYKNADIQRVGATHGIDLKQAFKDYGPQIKAIVTDLYTSKNTPGAWTRWLTLGEDKALTKDITDYTQAIRGKHTDLVVLGIGGSSLGGRAMLEALTHPFWNILPPEKRKGLPRFHFIENVDPNQIAALMKTFDPKTTLFNVITKSGTTPETMSAFMLVKDRLEKTLGKTMARQNIVVTTDRNKGILREIATKEGYKAFEVPDDVGGRYSVFSAVGLLPAALCGINIREIQRGLRDMDKVLRRPRVRQNPAAQGALIQYLMYRKNKPISVLMPYSNDLRFVANWYVQLWAESLGKKHDTQGKVVHKGPTPLGALGVTDQHSILQLLNEGPNDKVITFVQVKKPGQKVTIPKIYTQVKDLAYLGGKTFGKLLGSEFQATRATLTRSERPNVTLTLPKLTPYHFAQLLYLLEVQTAIMGRLMNINPFDQPGVEQAKIYTRALMGDKAYKHLVDEARGKK